MEKKQRNLEIVRDNLDRPEHNQTLSKMLLTQTDHNNRETPTLAAG